ncbi:cytochrome c oxidase subunit 3 [Kushneria phosphatilytica]|uniref:Cytochrome bo(3) ubiquinol oxidase subunit 3 n=1 Tax=Kushneria phosphatilytica TaxID=657387 RepID=A0A1S1P073_9GAMM|nr:cytochrome c oxidase subunit 3 [Kushneria phosphatilytica]OHV13930.1 cytochrome o ubiquinol oxidase subunit III [Kushneria phosphatilytica]QEL10494.1 cytochrome o ubiquinol oxidase subunit III [Kushneria phosphatilytica]
MSTQPSQHPGLNLGAPHAEAHSANEEFVFGFWVFMMSDLIIFGLLFATYVTMLGGQAGGPGPSDLFEMKSAFIETMLLLVSSFTFGMASLSLKYREDKKWLIIWLLITLVLGLAFIGHELLDFNKMFDKGGVPSRSGFLSAFFALVPLHGLHVTSACIWLLALLGQIAVYGLDTNVKVGLTRLAILWHFLDIVWIGIFSLVYLGGLA